MDDLSLEDIIANWLAGEERQCHAKAKTCLAKRCLFKGMSVCVCACVLVNYNIMWCLFGFLRGGLVGYFGRVFVKDLCEDGV